MKWLVGLLVVAACAAPATRPDPVANTTPAAPPAIALAVVYNAQELWLGNDDFEPEDSPARYSGALHDLVAAFDTAPPAAAFAEDSQGVVIRFATGARVQRPLGPLRNVTGAAFGAQKDFRSQIGTDLVQGVTLALEELGATELRPVIVILGDGNDTNNETATQELAALRAIADKRGASIHALVIKSPVSAEASVIGALTPNVRTIGSSGVANAVAEIWQREATR